MKRASALSMTIFSVVLLSLTGCGANTQTGPASPSSASSSTQTVASSTPAVTKTATVSTSAEPENLYIVVEPGAKLGPDGKKHDAFINGDIKITQGQNVTLHFLNYDDGTHTYTAPDLGLNVKIDGSKKKGEPAETTYTFTPDKTGDFNWICADPCDGQNNQWAMSNDGYMKGHITVLPATNKTQYVSLVINAGYKLGSDGKLHDAFTPADFTVLHGQPIELTVYNFDDGQHSVTIPDLNQNFMIKGSTKSGDPGISTTTFTIDKAGSYPWMCAVPCDGENGQWAMSQDGYMKGQITVK